jgi:long-chain acyl-CoA synthetase
MREKRKGIWQTWTWSQMAAEIRALACGLAAIGFSRGDTLAIVGQNRPRLYWTICAAQMLGGIPVPVYHDSTVTELGYVLRDAEIRFAVVEDQEQVDKLLQAQVEYPALAHLLYDEPRGLANYVQPGLRALDEVLAMGRARDAADPGYLDAEIAKGHTDDLPVILYTSGTTGNPKGVCQSYSGYIAAAKIGIEVEQLGPHNDLFSYLPMAWAGDFIFSYSQAIVAGFTINCPESGDTVTTDMREIGPTYYFAPPRVLENLLTDAMTRMEDATWIKRKLFDVFLALARRCGDDLLSGRAVSWRDQLLYSIGNLLIYGPLRDALGLGRIRVAYTGGAAVSPDMLRFFRSIGVNLKQSYGSAETCGIVSIHRNGHVKLDSVGPPAPGVEVKISENAEVLVRSKAVFKSYFKRPDATAAAIDAEGYYHTGDAGYFDKDGHLRVIGRSQEVGQLINGSTFLPTYVENKLKFFPYIKEAVCFGSGRSMVCAFFNIDVDAVGHWAQRQGIPYAGESDLARKPQVYDLISGCVERVNAELALDEAMRDSQVQRFLILHKALDPDDEEMTRTRKVRRGFVTQKYAVLVEALYSGKTSQFIETQIRFEDGRTGTITADLQIAQVQPRAGGA